MSDIKRLYEQKMFTESNKVDEFKKALKSATDELIATGLTEIEINAFFKRLIDESAKVAEIKTEESVDLKESVDEEVDKPEEPIVDESNDEPIVDESNDEPMVIDSGAEPVAIDIEEPLNEELSEEDLEELEVNSEETSE